MADHTFMEIKEVQDIDQKNEVQENYVSIYIKAWKF